MYRKIPEPFIADVPAEVTVEIKYSDKFYYYVVLAVHYTIKPVPYVAGCTAADLLKKFFFRRKIFINCFLADV